MGVLAVYVVLTLMFFADALGALPQKLLGDGEDNFAFAWNAWWVLQSICQGSNPYYCDVQFSPFGLPLVWHTLALMPSLVIALLCSITSPILAYNLVVIGLYPVAGLCGFALARHVTRDVAGALAGGVVFMFCPFMVSKHLGHLNLQCAALLPLYTLCLLGGLGTGARGWKWGLLLVYGMILFSNLHTAIFAGNVTLWYWLYCGLRSQQWKREFLRFWRLLKPVVFLTVLWGSVVVFYSVRYNLRPEPFMNLLWVPEPLSFVLPLHANSLWRAFVAPAGALGRQLANIELSVYLGWLVLPSAAAGWWLCRKGTEMRFMAVLFAAALVLSVGHVLQWHREVVTVAGVPIYLPMSVYRFVPVLGSVGQAGRYLVIGYMAMSVGAAGLVAWAGRRYGSRCGIVATVVVIGLTCVDYGFRPYMADPPMCAMVPGAGRVMDPRLGNARSLYNQTIHGRQLVGGYVARIPGWVRQRYAAMEGIGWFFQEPARRSAPPAREAILGGLRRLSIRYVTVSQGSDAAGVLEGCGLVKISEDGRDVTFVVEHGGEGPGESVSQGGRDG